MTARKRQIVYVFVHLLLVLQNNMTSAQGSSVRLVNSLSSVPNPMEGRLEILHAGEWRTVCSDSFTNISAGVACRSLGFRNNGAFINNHYGSGTGKIWLGEVSCNGTELGIDKCAFKLLEETKCNHDKDVSIKCGNAEDYAVRLINPKNPSENPMEGRVEIYYAGFWGTICDDGFKNDAAKVVCASLGYGYVGEYISNGYYGAGTGQIWLDDLICTGREQSIDKCKHRGWGVHNCDQNEDVSVKCGTLRNFTIRLVNSFSHISHPKEGRLEIYYDGSWGTVCADSFTNASARVACASLGFGHIGTVIGNRHGNGTGQIWLKDVVCAGTEQNISECMYSPWGVHNCTHDKDVSISCGYTIRLINSRYKVNNPEEGRLEIYYGGIWGTVCSDHFTDKNAKEACASLGLGGTGKLIGNLHGNGTGHIWSDIFTCNGTEQSIDMCSQHILDAHNYGHHKDVSIRCGDTPDFAVRLVNSLSGTSKEGRSEIYNVREGRLEIYYSGIWGTVCNDQFTDVSARVACASLGYGYVGEVIGNRSGGGTDAIWLDDVSCTGTESSIDQCSHRGWGVHNCGHGQDVSINCTFGAGQSADAKVIGIATLACLLVISILLATTFFFRNAYRTRQAERDNVVPGIRMSPNESSGQLDIDTSEAKTGETRYETLQFSGIYDELTPADYQTIDGIRCLKLQNDSCEETNTSA